jgi:hypothetical protein
MVLLAIIVTGLIADIYLAVAPSLLGAMVDYQGISPRLSGQLISYNFFGSGLGTLLAPVALSRSNWNIRLTMLAALVTVSVTSVLSVWLVGSNSALSLVRFLSGLGTGVGFTAACVALVGLPNVERWYAILYGSPFVVGGVGIALLPSVYVSVGVTGAFYGIAALCLAACALLPWFPRHIGEADRQSAPAPGQLSGAGWLASGLLLSAFFLHYVFNSGIWTYFERLGVSFGMTPEYTGAVLGPGMAAGIIGMLLASWLGNRMAPVRAITAGTLVIFATTALLLAEPSGLAFALVAALFNASIPFVTPYFVGPLSRLVPRGLGVMAANAALMLGFASGPMLVSLTISGDEFTGAILLTMAGFLAVLVLTGLFAVVASARGLLAREAAGTPAASAP